MQVTIKKIIKATQVPNDAGMKNIYLAHPFYSDYTHTTFTCQDISYNNFVTCLFLPPLGAALCAFLDSLDL